MPKLKVLPHADLCPQGALLDAPEGTSILDTLLANHIDIEHACEKSCACTTCHIVVRQGIESLDAAEEKEEDMLDKAWGLEANSRLGCQAKLRGADLTIEIPRYTINYAKEAAHK